MLRGLSRIQRDKVGEFKAVVPSAGDKTALECLRAANWQVEAGIHHYYDNSQKYEPQTADTSKLGDLYARFKAPDEPAIQAQGIADMCAELEVTHLDPAVLAIAWKMKAAHASEFAQAEFMSGMVAMRADSIESLKAQLGSLRASLEDPDTFPELYSWAYGWACEKGQKCLQMEPALFLWGMLLRGRQEWPLLDAWCTHLRDNHKRAITRDTWTQLLQFKNTIRPDMSNFNEDGAWPVVIDDFVDYVKNGCPAAEDVAMED